MFFLLGISILVVVSNSRIPVLLFLAYNATERYSFTVIAVLLFAFEVWPSNVHVDRTIW